MIEDLGEDDRLKIGVIGMMACSVFSLFTAMTSDSATGIAVVFVVFLVFTNAIYAKSGSKSLKITVSSVVIFNLFIGVGYIFHGIVLFGLVYYVFMKKGDMSNLLSTQAEDNDESKIS